MNKAQYLAAVLVPIGAHTLWVFSQSGRFLPAFAAEYSVRWIIFALLMGLLTKPQGLLMRGLMLGTLLGLNAAMTIHTFGQPLATLPIAIAIHAVIGLLGGAAAHALRDPTEEPAQSSA